MRRTLTALAIALLSAGAAAAQCPSPMTEGVKLSPDAQAFRQERHLKGASRSIVSSGVVSVEDGVVLWRVTTPIEIVTRIADDGVTQSIEGGPFEPVGETAGAGFSSQIGFAALLQADLKALESSYVIKPAKAQAEGDWTYALTPRNEQLADQISAIDVEGCETLETVRVRQANGDVILISLGEPVG